MKIDIIDVARIGNEISDSSRPVAVVIAPNFERRSVTTCELLAQDLVPKGVVADRIQWFVLTLQGNHPQEILDALKSIHTRMALSIIEAAGFSRPQIDHLMIDYPVQSERFASQMAQLFSVIAAEAELIIDFSAMPRNLLLMLLSQVSRSGRPDAPFPKVRRVWLTYAWTEKYPYIGGPEFVGGIIGHFTYRSLRELLHGKTHAEIILFTSGTGHDSFEVLQAVREAGLGHQIRIHLVIFMRTENFYESYRNLCNHYGLIDEAQRSVASVRYVFPSSTRSDL